MSFIRVMKDKTGSKRDGNVLHKGDEGQNGQKEGNVLHKGDEGQNGVKKRRKCPS